MVKKMATNNSHITWKLINSFFEIYMTYRDGDLGILCADFEAMFHAQEMG